MNQNQKNALSDFCAAYTNSEDAPDCLIRNLGLSSDQAAILSAAIAQGVSKGGSVFHAYLSKSADEAVSAAADAAKDYFGFSADDCRTAIRIARAHPSPSFIATDAALSMVRAGCEPLQPEKLAAAFYVTFFDHSSTENPAKTAEMVGYCIALQAKAVQQAHSEGSDLDVFLAENGELLDALAAVTLFVLVLAILFGACMLLNLSGLQFTLLYLVVVIGALAGVIAVSESVENGTLHEHLDNKATLRRSLTTCRLAHAQYAGGHTIDV